MWGHIAVLDQPWDLRSSPCLGSFRMLEAGMLPFLTPEKDHCGTGPSSSESLDCSCRI